MRPFIKRIVGATTVREVLARIEQANNEFDDFKDALNHLETSFLSQELTFKIYTPDHRNINPNITIYLESEIPEAISSFVNSNPNGYKCSIGSFRQEDLSKALLVIPFPI